MVVVGLGISRKVGNPSCIALASLIALSTMSSAWPCGTGSVRDAAFQAERTVHRLCVFGKQDDAVATQQFEAIADWLEREAPTLNVTVERIDVDDPTVRWRDLALPGPPPKTPVAALVGWVPFLRQAFIIDHWEPGPAPEDLAALLSSPARDALKGPIVHLWAVLLHSPAATSDGNAGAPVLEALKTRWDKEHAPGIAIVILDRKDPRERLLCGFAGIELDGPEWVGVAFGRGRLLAPPLQGDEITETNIEGLLSALTVPCTCLQEATTNSVDIPMTWEPSLDVLAGVATPAQGYVEIPVEERLAEIEAEIPTPTRGFVAAAVTPLVVGACTIIATLAFMLWRRRYRDIAGSRAAAQDRRAETK